MSRRTSRSLVLAALATIGALASAMVGSGSPAHAAVFYGLDCGIAGNLHAVGDYPPVYSVTGVATAGPYVVNGSNASLTCSLRRDGAGGAIIASWGTSSLDGSGHVPPMAPLALEETVAAGREIGGIWLCSRVSWTTINGPQTDVGCEPVAGAVFGSSEPDNYPWVHERPIVKPPDSDLDDVFIP